jgi:hypothetical protein
MLKLISSVAVAALLSCHSTNQSTMSNTEGKDWITLFDGQSTKGWHAYGKPSAGKAWKAENGVLHLDPATKKTSPSEGGDLVTDEEFDNFHLKLDWKISPKGNSGIIFFIHEAAEYQYPWQTGLEMQVLDNGTPTEPGHPDAKLYTHRAGDLYDLIAGKDAVKPVGEWNTAEIIANNGKLDFYLNGQHALSTNIWDDNWKKMVSISKFKDMPGFGKFRKGKIALQDHGDEVWYRNIRIKRL